MNSRLDDNADIPDNGNLIFTVNTVTLAATDRRHTTDSPGSEGAVLWQIGPFSPGMVCWDFEISTLTVDHVHLWLR